MKILVKGRVQGVGFRAATKKIAEGFNIKGWVKNLSDGRVEICAQGDKKKLEDFLGALRISFEGLIEDCEISFHSSSVVMFDHFTINH